MGFSLSRRKSGLFLIALFGFFLVLPGVAANYTYAIDSHWTSSPPSLDGTMDSVYQEKGAQIAWYITPNTPHKRGFNYVYILNDANFLYIFIDLLSDNTTDPLDVVFIFLDSDNSESMGADLGFSQDRNDANTDDPRLNYSFQASANAPYNHVQWEIRLNLSVISNPPAPGDIIGYLFAVYGTLAPQHYYPANNYTELSIVDESTYNKLQLATAPGIELTNWMWILILIGSVLVAIVITNRLSKK